MKVLALICAVISLANGKGSGPYLPSGWRPDGPSFFLPSEVVNPSPTPATIVNLEASGSDAFREYGPPKVEDISQNLLSQGLPDVNLEQRFGVPAPIAVPSQAADDNGVAVSGATESTTTASQASIDDNPPISAEVPILDFVVTETTAIPNNVQETVSQPKQQVPQGLLQYVEQTKAENSATQATDIANEQNLSSQTTEATTAQSNQQDSAAVSTIQEQPTESQQESTTASDLGKVTPSDVITEVLLVNVPEEYKQNVAEPQNIPDIIADLNKEILATQSEVKQPASEVSYQPWGQLPEGFLEYGPPGLIEYGPPKEDQEKSETLQAIETNETRRRRFSPRIRFFIRN